MRPTTADLFPPAETMPAGFDYRPDSIDRAEEAALVAELASLDFAPYEFRGVQARRRVVAFGYRNDYRTRRVEISPDIPAFLLILRDKVASFAITTTLLVCHCSRQRRCVCAAKPDMTFGT